MALLYMHLSNTLFKEDDNGKQGCLKSALKILEHSQDSLRGKRVTFICGDSGENHRWKEYLICPFTS